jgi:hypothetical protein
MGDFAEKRDFLRMPIDCELKFSQSGSDHSLYGNVINLSHRGILFTSTERFNEGAILEILLTPSHSGTLPIAADGIVSRVTHNDEVYEIACQIADFR